MILGECILLSSLPGKALRTLVDIALVDIARLAERFNMRDSTCVLKAEPGKLDIIRHGPGILFIS